MSNSGHQDNERDCVGMLFRRMTLSSLGLDAMDGVSSASRSMLEGADLFAQRLLGGVMKSVSGQADVSKFEARIGQGKDFTLRSSHLGEGPRRATDVGEWRYWLDAVLLMLYNDEADESLLGVSASQVKARARSLAQAGVSASKLSKLGLAQREHVFKQAMSERDEVLVSQRIREQLDSISQPGSSAMSLFGEGRGEDLLLSKISVRAQESVSGRSVDALERWSKSLLRMQQGRGRSERVDRGLIREMTQSLKDLETVGIVDAGTLRLMDRFEANYFEKMLRSDEHFLSTIREFNAGNVRLSSLRMLEPSAKHGEVMQGAVRRRVSVLSSLVDRYVQSHGDNEATEQWARAIDRFERLSGFSLEVDKVLLRELSQAEDVLESSSVAPKDLVHEAMRLMKSERGDGYEVARKQDSSAGLLARVQTASESIYQKLAQSVEGSASLVGLETSMRKLSQRKGMSLAEDELLLSDLAHELEILAQRELNRYDVDAAVVSAKKFYERLVGLNPQLGARSEIGTSLARMSSASLGLTAEKQLALLTELSGRLESLVQGRGFGEVISGYADVDTESVKLRSDLGATATEAEHFASNARESEMRLSAQDLGRQSIAHDEAELSALLSAEHFASNARESEVRLSAQDLAHAEAELSALLSEALSRVTGARRRVEAVQLASSARESGLRLSAQDLSRQSIGHVDSVVLEGDRIDTKYLQSIGSSLSVLSKVLGAGRIGLASDEGSGQIERRMGRMLNLLSVNDAEQTMDEKFFAEFGERHLSVRELSPQVEMLTHLKQELARTDSGRSADLTQLLGADKAMVNHLSSLLSGQDKDGARALQSAIAQSFVSRLEQEGSGVLAAKALSSAGLLNFDNEQARSYSHIAGDLDTVKLSLSLTEPKSQSFSLKQNIEFSHLPPMQRQAEQAASQIQARLDLEQSLASERAVQNFVPISLGAKAFSAEQTANSLDASVRSEQAEDMGSAEFAQVFERYVSRQNSDYAGVDLNFGPEAYVRMVARPELRDAKSNQVARTFQEQASREALSSAIHSLRKIYVEELTERQTREERYGKLSESFNSSNFANVLQNLGVVRSVDSRPRTKQTASDMDSLLLSSKMSATHSQSQDTVRAQTSELGSYPGVLGNAMNFFVPVSAETSGVKEELARYLSGGNLPSLDTNSVQAVREMLSANTQGDLQELAGEAQRAARAVQNKQNSEVLGRIDSLLDYVEAKSANNVGVFSSNDTVRVLLEALPESGYLGEKGLPQWRVKNQEAVERANQKELREALRKIGAAPIQGVQAHSEKSYVNPFAMKKEAPQNVADPLFSGGSEGGSTPAATPFSSWGDLKDITDALPSPQFIRMLAEEVYQRILENLSEELQRRRTE